MKFQFIINYAFRLFQKDFSETLKIIVLSIIICIIIFIAIVAVYFLKGEINRLSNKVEIVLLMDSGSDEQELMRQINNLKNEPEFTQVKFITNLDAIRKFATIYGYNSEDLLLPEALPHIVLCKVNEDEQTSYRFHYLISKLKTKYSFKDILYREDLVSSIISFKKNVILTGIIIGSVILAFLMISLFFIFKGVIINKTDDADTLAILGSGKIIYYGGTSLFIIIAVIFGVVFGLAIILSLWNLSEKYLEWLNIDIINILTLNFIVSLIINIFTLCVVILFSKPLKSKS